MATEISQEKVDKLVKQGKSQPEVAAALGVTAGQLGMLRYGKGLVAAGKLKKAPKTDASFKKLRGEGMRFEYIAAATGASVSEVKSVVGDTQIARGRKAGAKTGVKTVTNRKTGTAGRGASKKTSAGRSSGRSASKKTAARGGKARTRAERAARAGNPS